MSKGRDWVDYANLASSVTHNVQLADVQAKLGALASVEAERQRRVEEERRLREVIVKSGRNATRGAWQTTSGPAAWTRHGGSNVA